MPLSLRERAAASWPRRVWRSSKLPTVICPPNQKILKLVDENTSVLDTFKLTNELLVEGVRGIGAVVGAGLDRD
jgi:cell division GTPase FtsZ